MALDPDEVAASWVSHGFEDWGVALESSERVLTTGERGGGEMKSVDLRVTLEVSEASEANGRELSG